MSFESVLKMKRIFSKSIFIQSIAALSAVCLLFVAVSYSENSFDQKEGEAQAISDVGCPLTGTWVGLSDFCIMRDDFGGTTSWEDATQQCRGYSTGARLCTADEWTAACLLDRANSISLNDMSENGDEWVGDMISTTQAAIVGDDANCAGFSSADVGGGDDNEWRCCINKDYD